MSETEIVEWLLRWLLEFGPEPVPWEVRSSNLWYIPYMRGEITTPVHGYYAGLGGDTAGLTPAAWKLLENYHESNH